MGIWEWLGRKNQGAAVQTARGRQEVATPQETLPLRPAEARIYEGLREAVPIIDAAVEKIVRLAGGVRLECSDPTGQAVLQRFCQEVAVGASGQGLDTFLAGYLGSLLTYGNAVGEMVLSPDGRELAALYLPDLAKLEIRPGATPLEAEIRLAGPGGSSPLPYPQLILFSALNPKPGQVRGESLLRGLPALSGILMTIYQAMGNNFERMGSLRYAVTYRPGPGGAAGAKEIAQTIAREWSGAMTASSRGEVRDFVAVGDVDIKVIGADNQYIDTQVPVRQILEQIVAKLGLPPFLLGLSWSTTERMSRQQADMLTSELESYRSLLTPVVMKIGRMVLALAGLGGEPQAVWDSISLQDETDIAQARLINAQAAEIEKPAAGYPRG